MNGFYVYSNMLEKWKDIKGYKGVYKISNFGRIYTKHKCRIKSPNIRIYIHANLYLKGEVARFKVHRLVAEYFLKNDNNFPQINHIDGNKHNNNVFNLEWCNNSYNQKHAYRIGLKTGANTNPVRGEKHYSHKLKEKEVLFLRKTKRNNKYYCKKYNISRTTLKRIRNRKIWRWL